MSPAFIYPDILSYILLPGGSQSPANGTHSAVEYNQREGTITVTTSMIITTVIECAVGLFIIWGLFNEDKLVDFEDGIVRSVKGIYNRKRADGSRRSATRREV